jgi:TonB-linked SusC/RagA family outer membrane protein
MYMRKRLLLFCALSCMLLATVTAQVQKISGKVTDESTGQPIEGASIVVKGQNKGAITNSNGEFRLNVSAGNMIVFSGVGYAKQEFKVGTQTIFSVKLQNQIGALNDVVVVGYGKQKKKDVIAAISTVKGEDIAKMQTPSGYLALQGQVPGLIIRNTGGSPGGGDVNVTIRGMGSLQMGSSPYIIIDGNPADPSDLTTLDMASVENVSVLKDAAASAIYGLKAANGVLLITTKRGKDNGGKMKLSYNGYAAYQSPTKMPDPVTAVDYMRYSDSAANNNGVTILPYPTLLINDYINLGVDNYNRYNTDWKDIIIAKGAWMQNHSITLTGGTEKLRSAVSGSYFTQDGLVANNNFQRYTLRANNDFTISSWVKAGLDANFLQTSYLNPQISTATSLINKALTFVPIKPGINNDGTWAWPNGTDNPIGDAVASGTSKSTQQVFGLNGNVIMTPVKGLTSTSNYSIRSSTNRGTIIAMPYSMYDQFANLKGTNFNDTSVAESWSQYTIKTVRTQLDYKITLAQQHNFAILAGTQYENDKTQSLGAKRTGFPYDPNYMVINDGNAASATNNGNYGQLNLLSFFQRFSYNYAGKYFLEVNLREDASSAFSLPQYRWGTFPSAAVGWRISEENFFKPAKRYIDELKIRGSRGILGNAQFPTANGISSYYASSSLIATGYSYPFDKNIITGAIQTVAANPQITWETTRVTNVGLDATLLKGIINVTFDYFDKYTYNLLATPVVPNFVGMQPGFINNGSMDNKGWELAVGYTQNLGDFKLRINANISDIHNKIISFPGSNSTYGSQRLGYPFSPYWGYKSAGIFQNQTEINNWPGQFGTDPNDRSNTKPGYVKYVDMNGDGKIDVNDQVYLGSNNDVHFPYSCDFKLEWKGIDLDAFIQGVGQRINYISGTGITPFSGGSTIFKYQANTWSPTNPNAPYPILMPDGLGGNNWLVSDKTIGNASYLRLKLLSLGYSIPKKVMDKLNIVSARIYVSAQNLLTFSNFYSGFDPEISASGTTYYPVLKTATIGINVNF